MPPADPEPRRAVLSRDTDGEAERLQISLWQRMSAGDRLRSATAASMATRLSLAAIRMRAPHADESARLLTLASLTLGLDLVRRIYGAAVARQLAPMIIMDLGYLDGAAARIDVSDFLRRALRESGLEP